MGSNPSKPKQGLRPPPPQPGGFMGDPYGRQPMQGYPGNPGYQGYYGNNGLRPPPAPPRGIIRGARPVPGFPRTYGNTQEQLFTTNNFAPAPRNPHNVNFRDQLVTPSEPPASRHPAQRPEQPIETADPNDPNVPNGGSDTQPTFEPERTERVDVLSPPSPMRHCVNRPHRDWDNLRMMSQPPSHYRSGYPYREPVMRYSRHPGMRQYDPYSGRMPPPQMMPRGMPGYRGPPPPNAYLPPRHHRPPYQMPSDYLYPEDYPNPPPRIRGYEDAYIPPEPPAQDERRKQTDFINSNQPPAQHPQDMTADQMPPQAAVQQIVQQSQHTQPLQAAPPMQAAHPILAYHNGGSVPVSNAANGDYYEVESLLSDSKQTKEDESEEQNMSPRDIEIMRRSQQSTKADDDDYIGANLRFYRNEIRYRPNGEYIDTIHKYWKYDYQRLANNTTYMPWLFPLPEKSSVNPFAEPLKQHEARHIRKDVETRERLMRSYKMMLDFLGIQLLSENTGQVKRGPNWKQRFDHLKRSKRTHDRITRILTSLGRLGFPHLQAPLVLFLIHETVETRELSTIPFSALRDWHHSIDNNFDANYVVDQFKKYKKPKDYASLSNRKTEPVQNTNVVKDTKSMDTKPTNDTRMSDIPENVEQETVQQAREDRLYYFDGANRGAEIDQGGSHTNKDKRLTYRSDEDTVTYTRPKADTNTIIQSDAKKDTNAERQPDDDVNNNTHTSTEAYSDPAMTSPRNESQAPVPGPSYSEPYAQDSGNLGPPTAGGTYPRDVGPMRILESQPPPPAYSEHDPY